MSLLLEVDLYIPRWAPFRSVTCLGAVIFLCTVPAWAGFVNEPTPGLPPALGDYVSPQQVHACFAEGFGNLCLINGDHGAFTNIDITFSSGNEIETFDSQFHADAMINTSLAGPVDLSGPVSIEVFGRTSDNQLGTFATQMLSMDLTGSALGHSLEVMLDPSQPSTGATTIMTNNGPGLPYQISSFFDVFTELSLDGGPYVPSSNGPALVQLTTPEPGTLALFGIVGLAALASRRRLRRG